MTLPAQRYDLTQEYMDQIKPLVEQLAIKCQELGMPMVASFWTSLTADQSQVSSFVGANRPEVTDMFVHVASIAPGASVLEAAQSINAINQIGAKFYSMKIEDGYQVFDPVHMV